MPSVPGTHHVEIGGHYYLVRPGSYVKRVAPEFGARFTSGDPDWNNTSFWQHWAQRCFVGGMDAEEFADDAMYDDGVGVDTTQHERVTLARDLKKGSGGGWGLEGGANERRFIVYNNTLLCVSFDGKLYKWDPGTDGWVHITQFVATGVRSIAVFNGRLYVGAINSGIKLYWSSGDLTSWSQVSNPAGVGLNIYAMRAYNQKLYVAYGTKVWRLKTDNTWDGNTVFYDATASSESNYIRAMEVHNGFLYMGSYNGHIHRTDGNSTFDIWNWDGQTIITDLRSFDGRLFVSTLEYTSSVNEGWGALYQMSGSAVTLLKKWGKAGRNSAFWSIRAYDRKLFYGASNLYGLQTGFGVAVYDPVEDSHSIWASNSDSVTYASGAAPYMNYTVDDVFYYAQRMWVSVRGHGVFYVRYSWHDFTRLEADYDTTKSGVQIGPQNGGWFTTSTYDGGMAGVRKLWRKISLDYTLPHTSTSIYVEYSVNGGTSWTEMGTISSGQGDVVGARSRKHFYLNNIISVSFKMRFTLRATNSLYTPVFWGFVTAYVPVIEPNWIWTMTLVVNDKQELRDGTIATVDADAELQWLRNTYRTKQMVHYTDLDGSTWASGGQPGVLIKDIEFRMFNMTEPLEGEVNITLLEAVESY